MPSAHRRAIRELSDFSPISISLRLRSSACWDSRIRKPVSHHARLKTPNRAGCPYLRAASMLGQSLAGDIGPPERPRETLAYLNAAIRRHGISRKGVRQKT